MQLHCRTYGDPTSRPVVLLHGLFGSSANWGRVARQLEDRYRLLVPDLRNHGRSAHASVHDYPSMAADVIALLDRAKVDRAVVVGHSMGGKVAMHLALTAPRRIAGLAVVDMAPVSYAHDFDTVLEAFGSVDLAALQTRADADRQLRAAVPNSGVRAFLLQNLERRDGLWQWRLNRQALTDAQQTITGFPDYPESAVFARPCVFIHGALSDYLKPSHHATIRRRFPTATMRCVDGAGHWVYADQPEAFIELLEDFLVQSY